MRHRLRLRGVKTVVAGWLGRLGRLGRLGGGLAGGVDGLRDLRWRLHGLLGLGGYILHRVGGGLGHDLGAGGHVVYARLPSGLGGGHDDDGRRAVVIPA